jgi:hypothetical protein
MENKMKEEMKNPEMGLTVEIETAEQEDSKMYEDMAPSGRFSRKTLNNLVKATNRLLPLFEQEPNYPEFQEDINGPLPVDFVRVLAMFQGAVNSAVDNEMVEPEMDFLMEDITDDGSLKVISGKIDMLARSKDFKRFLANPPEEEMEEEEVSGAESAMEGEEMTTDQMDQLFSERM